MNGGGTFTLTNAGSVTSGTGIELQALAGSMAVNSGTLNLNNTFAISGGIGAGLNIADNLTLQSSLSITSSSTFTGGTGSFATVGGDFTMPSGTLTVNNTGNLSGTASGVGMQVLGGSFAQTGGTITVMNSGTNSGSGHASYIQSTPTIAISGTGVFNNPNALVAAPAVMINSGGTLQSGTPTVPGVFDNAAFGGTNIVTLNSGGSFVSGTLDPAPGQTLINGTFTQNSGTYTVVIGNLNLPGNQGISFLTDNGTGVVNLLGGTLNVIPATGFDPIADVPAGLEMVQFIQASVIINGGFTPVQITNTVP